MFLSISMIYIIKPGLRLFRARGQTLGAHKQNQNIANPQINMFRDKKKKYN